MSTFHGLYDVAAALAPSEPAFVCWRQGCPRVQRSYAELVARSALLAAGLQQELERIRLSFRGLRSLASAVAIDAGATCVIAVAVPRTHPDFLPLLVALSRCGATFALLSTDLTDWRLQEARNQVVMQELQPCLVVAASADLPSFGQLAASFKTEASAVEDIVGDNDDTFSWRQQRDIPLCFLFTGGTTRERCVAVTHAMVKHENAAYPAMLQLAPPVQVLANTSVHWGASALGQLSIALAYTGCAVICEAAEPDELRAAIDAEKPDVLGLVPDQLSLLAEEPAEELPHIRAIFTWGEALPLSVAERWRGHPRARLRDLLISTEYWLSLYAAPLEGNSAEERFFRAVPGVQVAVLREDGEQAQTGEVGELLLSGPMVTPGYLPLSTAAAVQPGAAASPTPQAFCTFYGVRYFRTRDLVCLRGGKGKGGSSGKGKSGGAVVLEFRGRLDMTAKKGGKWVDLTAAERALQAVPGITGAAVLPHLRTGEPLAHVVLAPDANHAAALRLARGALPRNTEVRVLDRLPRHQVTRKVDVKQLKHKAAGNAASWPLDPELRPEPRPAARLAGTLQRSACWTILPFIVAASWNLRAVVSRRRPRPTAVSQQFLRAAARLWAALAGFVLLPYMHLAYIYADERWSWVMALHSNIPFGTYAGMAAALLGHSLAHQGSSQRARCGALVRLWAACGALLALRRGRFRAWPAMYWAGIGLRLDYDCSKWLRFGTWERALNHYVAEALDKARALLPFSQGEQEEPVREKRASYCTAGELSTCRWSNKLLRVEWPPPDTAAQATKTEGPVGGAWDGGGQAISWPYWALETAAAFSECTTRVQDAFPERLADLLVNPTASSAEVEPGGPAAAAGIVEPEAEVPPGGGAAGGKPDGGETGGSSSQQPADRAAAATQSTPSAADASAAAVAAATVAAAAASAATVIEEDADGGEGGGGGGGGGQRRWSDRDWKRYNDWWWRHCLQDTVDVAPDVLDKLRRQASGAAVSHAGGSEGQEATLAADPNFQRVRRCVADITELPVESGVEVHLHSLDSLTVALLAARLRSEFAAPSLGSAAVRRAATLPELLEEVQAAQKQQQQEKPPVDLQTVFAESLPKAARNLVPNHRDDYAVFYSPGQYFPMGGWVLRSDALVDPERMRRAAELLIDRHVALRTKVADPLRLLSFIVDGSIVFTLVARMMERMRWPMPLLRRSLSDVFCRSWPRLDVQPRRERFRHREGEVPFEVFAVNCQEQLEQTCRSRREALGQSHETVDIALLRMDAQLVGLWVYGYRGGEGDFVIMPNPVGSDNALLFFDRSRSECGLLVGPGDPRWRPPPKNFPALLCARLVGLPGEATAGSGGRSQDAIGPCGIVWLRLGRQREMVVVRKPDDHDDSRWTRSVAFGMPGASCIKTPFSYLAVHAMHTIADGYSYEAIVGDLLSFYVEEHSVPPLTVNALGELQRRLNSGLRAEDPRAFPQQCSMRGNMWRYPGRLYSSFGHVVNFRRHAVVALRHLSAQYGAPVDAVLLAIAAVAIAQVDAKEEVPFTLYVPLRDGPGEAGVVGMFTDWRDIVVSAETESATILGVILEVAHTLRTRRWAIFNALKKPDVTMVNFSPLDAAPPGSRGGFTQIHEEHWRQGDRLGRHDQRGNEMGKVVQPLALGIEERDKENWLLHCNMAVDVRPPAWCQRFVRAVERAFRDALELPLRRVHVPEPDWE